MARKQGPHRSRKSVRAGIKPSVRRAALTPSFPPSCVQYFDVRARQIEGAFPGDPTRGCWPISWNRVAYGWGMPTVEDWPDEPDLKQWPPVEPPLIDEKAKRNRLRYYQRTRTIEDCTRAIDQCRPPNLSVEITDSWFDASNGVIPPPHPDDEIIGSHSFAVVGYDNYRRVMKFANSWGRAWGEDGYGYLPYDYFADRLIESWFFDLREGTKPLAESVAHAKGLNTSAERRAIQLMWGHLDILQGEILHGREIYDLESDERMAWAFAVPRDGFLDIEELYVRPNYRRRGYGMLLSEMLHELSDQVRLPLRAWIPWADCGEEDRDALNRILGKLGLSLRNTSQPWAAYVAAPGKASQPLAPIRVPERPAMPLGGKKLAASAMIAASTYGGGDPSPEPVDHSSAAPVAASQVQVDIPEIRCDEREDVEAGDFLPDVEYEFDFDVPPHQVILCNGIVTTVEDGRRDLPLTDNQWESLGLDEDEE